MNTHESTGENPVFDILISGGIVIDGTGSPRYQADIGIKGDAIVAIGELPESSGATVIDATNKVVAPGFVDVHNHSDSWLLNTPNFISKTSQGFTTEVIMADGISYAPVDRCTAADWVYYLQSLDGLYPHEYTGWESLQDYMNLIDGKNVQNVMTHIPYANLRSMACGFGRQRVDDFQMKQICADVRKGMEAGAVGLSTGLDYVAQCFSTTDELVEACQAMAEYDGLYVSHIRYKKSLMPAIEELVEIGKRAGVKVHISHMKGQHPGQAEEALEYIDKVARHEVDISFDVYPYQPGSTMLHFLLPYEVFEDGPKKAIEKLKQPEMQLRFKYGLENYLLDISAIQIAWVLTEKNKQHQGKSLSQYVEESGLPKEEALINLLIEASQFLRRDVAGVRIQLFDHATQRCFEQLAAIDILDVVSIDLLERIDKGLHQLKVVVLFRSGLGFILSVDRAHHQHKDESPQSSNSPTHVKRHNRRS